MKTFLTWLIPGLLLSYGAFAQCGFSASISTSKDYCLGSTLQVTSSHTPATIVWYKDGVPAAVIKAAENLSTKGETVAFGIGGFLQGIYVDEKENLYTVGDNAVTKWPASGGSSTVAGGNGTGNAPDQLSGPSAVYADPQGNVYVCEGGQIVKWAPGAKTGTIILSFSINELGPGSTYFECNGNIYFGDGKAYAIDRWIPGETVPTIVAQLPQQSLPSVILPRIDREGNLMVLDAAQSTFYQFLPGATIPTTYSLGTNTTGTVIDMSLDGDDTAYLVRTYQNDVVKWAPGMSSPITLFPTSYFATGQFNASLCSICRDQYGSIYVGDQGNARVMKFAMTSSINSSFTPTEIGQYYAIVTDMRGFSQTTDSVLVNVPQGQTSIQITSPVYSTPVCTPVTFTSTVEYPGPDYHYQWEVSGVPVGSDMGSYTNNLFADGDRVFCILKTTDGCTGRRIFDTSNVITMEIDPQGTAAVHITASDTAICQGTPVTFDAAVTNGSTQPTFQWLLGGKPIPGDDTAAYHTDSLKNGDILTCIITSDDACGLAKSNSIPVEVSPPPSVGANQVFNIQYGQSIRLDPVVTGTIISYLWTPGAGLSDSTIADPLADPKTTTDYKLTIVSAGCGADSGYILVNVYTPLSIPNAFTPNGDGHNDILYVLGGPDGSEIEDFAVFSRWGQAIFQTHNAAPGDPTHGWNGYIDGKPAPPGTYVYQVILRNANGTRQSYHGTVLLIR